MSIRFFDSFDHSASVTEKWKNNAYPAEITFITSWKHTGTRSRQYQSAGTTTDNMSDYVSLGTNEAKLWAACRVHLNHDASVLDFLDGTSVQVCVFVNAPNIKVYRGADTAGTLLSTVNVGAVAGGDDHLEAAVKIHGTTGTVDVYWNGINVLSLIGLNTSATGNAYANAIGVGKFSTASGFQGFAIDNFVCADAANGQTQIGDAQVYALYPSGAGTTTGFTPSTGANYTDVDEAIANGDTDYVSAAAAAKDTYAIADLAASGNILSVGVNVVAKDDGGLATPLIPVLRSGGSDYDGTSVAQSANYTNNQSIWNLNPATGAAWSGAGFNAIEAGQRRN